MKEDARVTAHNHIRTLLTYVPPDSLGLATSALGRVLFLTFATGLALYLLHRRPCDYLQHLVSLVAYAAAIVACGAHRFLKTRPVLMLLVTCSVLGIVNIFLTPDWVAAEKFARMRYGAARALAYAQLSFATLFVGCMTRPSDPARLVSWLSKNPRVLLVIAIPFSTFGLLATTYKDIVSATRARLSHMRWRRRYRSLVVSVAACLLAVALERALYLYQSSSAFSEADRVAGRSRVLCPARLLVWHDLLLLGLLVPGLVSSLIL